MGNDPSVLGGALTPYAAKKWSRALEIARDNRIPYVSFVESAGADLRVEPETRRSRQVQTDHFAESGRSFYEMIELSKLGIPTVCVVFGSSTAGGAYQPGLSDYVIVVKEQSKIFLAGPPLVKMATGEESDDETPRRRRAARRGVRPRRLLRRGRDGRHPHLPRGGVAPQLAQARSAGRRCAAEEPRARPRGAARPGEPRPAPAGRRPRRDRPRRRRLAVRGVQARATGRRWCAAGRRSTATRSASSATTACSIPRPPRRRRTSSSCATRSTCRWCSSRTSPATWWAATSRRRGIIKKGSQMINAVTNSTVPHLTVIIGSSYGAGTYGMSGRAFGNRFTFLWPTAKIAVMGPKQIAGVMSQVRRGQAARRGHRVRRGGGRQDRRRGRGACRRQGSLALRRHRCGQRRRHHRSARHAHGARHVPVGRAQPRRSRAPRLRGVPAVSAPRPFSTRAASPTAARSPGASFRTARAMGLRCVAVYADADADAPVRAPRPTRPSALDRAATSTVDGDHRRRARAPAPTRSTPATASSPRTPTSPRRSSTPGWCGSARRPRRSRAMGDKIAAKRRRGRRRRADASRRRRRSRPTPASVGLPAARQGGGRRRRQGHARSSTRPDDLAEAVAAARREAAGAFGDDTGVPRALRRRASRHVEIQILGDTARQRSCTSASASARSSAATRRSSRSRRRRSSTTRHARRAWATRPSRWPQAIGYTRRGTVEFLVDDATREFFFLEVNTRLQVEHPVTEAVTGIDLVREQMRVAMGEPLGFGAGRRRASTAHAIEVRLYAEDPAAGFLPATGTVAAFEPAPTPAVRWDSGVETGSRGRRRLRPDARQGDRPRSDPARGGGAARARPRAAPPRPGSRRTATSSSATLRHPGVPRRATRPPTSSSDCRRPRARTRPTTRSSARGDARRPVAAGPEPGATRRCSPTWRAAGATPDCRRSSATFTVAGRTVDVRYAIAARRHASRSAPTDGAVVHRWTPDGDRCRGRRRGEQSARVTPVGGRRLRAGGPADTVALDVVPALRRARAHPAAAPAGSSHPCPVSCIDVRCQPGDDVTAGQTLIVLEAMKMEHHMNAPADGRVAEVRVAIGRAGRERRGARRVRRVRRRREGTP